MTAAVVFGFVGAAQAQVFSRPNPPPLVTADGMNWFLIRDPITFSGSLYYPAGARVFFDGNVMVRVGTYQSIPLYADATLEPYSMVLVPLSGGRMQPYERRRENDLAGTTGSRPPSFPINTPSEPVSADFALGLPLAQVVPTAAGPLQTPSGMSVAIPAAAPLAQAPATAVPPRVAPAPAARENAARGTSGRGPTVRRIWIDYAGARWLRAGAPVTLDNERFVRSGEYQGFPVYTDRRGIPDPDQIYVSATGGSVLTPYRRER